MPYEETNPATWLNSDYSHMLIMERNDCEPDVDLPTFLLTTVLSLPFFVVTQTLTVLMDVLWLIWQLVKFFTRNAI